ncbi:MAG: glycosyltransferase family 2 protein [Treponema sp.]|nr:glycosyltransferase family 2 protein [Treponema sp.]
MRQGFVIPVYNHGDTLENVVSALAQYKLPIIVVDDGNDQENKNYIQAVARKYQDITVIENKRNRGKGWSVCRAIKQAHQMGITHLFQIDADGQHDTQATCKDFLEASKANPDALICGVPEFDSSLPPARAKAKKVSNAWTEYTALSKGQIPDGMCGYRIYPVEPFYKICRRAWIDSHMGFDAEILVRMIWADVPVIYKNVRVTYPVGGKSNFRVVRDNIHISFTFARLTIGMWLRYPWLKARQIKRKKQNEKS